MEAAELTTVLGAGAVAGIAAQFAKLLFTLPTWAVRSVALVGGLTTVIIATPITDPITLILAISVGCQAGISAWAAFDTLTEGISYRVQSD